MDGLEVKNLTVTAKVRGGKRQLLADNISFSVSKGKRLAIVGQSGGGKSMTALAILGLLPDNCTASGSVLFNGEDLMTFPAPRRRALLGRQIALIPQSGADSLNPSLKIRTQLFSGLIRAGVKHRDLYSVACELLLRAGLNDPDKVLRLYPFQLSGGMAQRVVTAIASCSSPELVIADEPTRGMDEENIAAFIKNLSTSFASSCVILITHDLGIASVCDNITVIDGGRVAESGKTREVLLNPQSEALARLLRSVPKGGHKNA